MTDAAKVALLREVLVLIMRKHLREADTDRYEYCPDCNQHPYHHPPHKSGCLFVLGHKVLEETA